LALGALFVAYITIFLVNLPMRVEPLFITFSMVMFAYTLNRLTDVKEDEINVPKRAFFIKKYGKSLLVTSAILYIIALIITGTKNLIILFLASIPILLGFAYSIFKFKRIFVIKNIFVGISWGILPLITGFFFGRFDLLILYIAFFIGIEFFINTVIFDVKDIKGDLLENIRTLPNIFGIRNTQYVLHILNILVALSLVLGVFYNILPTIYLLLLFYSFYMFICIYLLNKNIGDLFYGIIVDGEFLFMTVVIGLYTVIISF